MNWVEAIQARAPESPGVGPTYMLSQEDVGDLIVQSGGADHFISELYQELESVYGDTELGGSDRFGFTKGYETMEWMECVGPDYRVGKWIGSHPGAPVTVNGTMLLYERGKAGEVLTCDAGLLTATRTATTTALALNKLKPDLETLSVIGAGHEGRTHASVIAMLFPGLRRILFRDKVREESEAAVAEVMGLADTFGARPDGSFITSEVAELDDRRVESESDAIITATLAQEEVLSTTQFKEGVVIAAVGGDMVGKRELSSAIYRRARFVADELRQSLREGELQHAAGQIGLPQAEATTYHGSLLGGRVIGITDLLQAPEAFLSRSEPITVYDSTGFAGQDLAVGRLMMRLLKEQAWQPIQFHPPRSGMSFRELRRAGHHG